MHNGGFGAKGEGSGPWAMGSGLGAETETLSIPPSLQTSVFCLWP